jgi:hypothetical protein
VRTNGFADLHAEGIAGLLKIFLPAETGRSTEKVTIHASADEPGHWPVRDWRPHEMRRRGSMWETAVPFESLDIPIIYFLEAADTFATNLSGMRICWPRGLGLEEAPQLAWNFLEGFEAGFEGWTVVAANPHTPGLALDPVAHSGHASLLVRRVPTKTSVTVSTTRIRGWQILDRGAVGLRLWLRTREGIGEVRFTLHANAFSSEQTVSGSEVFGKVGSEWRQIDLPFASFPRLPLAAVDWFTIEFISAEADALLIDDIQFLSRGGREL